MSEQQSSELSPKQAADVICYYYAAENPNAIKYQRQRAEVPLALVALHTTQSRHSILPDGKQLLTYSEMIAGIDYLRDNPDDPNLPVQPTPPSGPISPEDATEIEKLVDSGIFNQFQAEAKVLGYWPH